MVLEDMRRVASIGYVNMLMSSDAMVVLLPCQAFRFMLGMTFLDDKAVRVP